MARRRPKNVGVVRPAGEAGSKAANGPGQPRRKHADPEQARTRQDIGEKTAQKPFGQRPRILFLDLDPRLIDEVHVVHPRGAGGHAGEAGETAIDVLDHLLRRLAVVLQHVLDQVDPATGTIELVTQQDVGRTGRRTEAAMDAGAQDFVGFPDVGIGELGEGKFGLHGLPFRIMCAPSGRD